MSFSDTPAGWLLPTSTKRLEVSPIMRSIWRDVFMSMCGGRFTSHRDINPVGVVCRL